MHKKAANFPANIYLFKVTSKRCEIRSKLTIKTPEQRHWRRSGSFIVNFEKVNLNWASFTGFPIFRPIF